MKKIHLVVHTHWDREWHKTAEQFRVRLVSVMDMTIDLLEKKPDYSYFVFDGQTVVIDDYLEVRPEQEQRLRRLAESGRLIFGPWHTQPDEYIPSGESLVRNLLIGMQDADRLGGCMGVGYLPDSFGQSAQMPQIIKGVGLSGVVIWRGVSHNDISKDVAVWQGQDGSRVKTIYLPLGYGYNRYMPFERQAAYDHILSTAKKIEHRQPNEHILLLSGSDHAAPHPTITELVKYVNEELYRNGEPYSVELSSYENYFREVFGNGQETVAELYGELRNPEMMRVHAGDASSRMDIKYANRQSEILLENYVEPIKLFETLLSEKHGSKYMFSGNYPNSMINKAWKYLCQNQCHDSLCACNVDEVNADIMHRFSKINDIGTALLHQTEKFFELNTDMRDYIGKPVLVLNTLPYKRCDLGIAKVYSNSSEFSLMAGSDEIPYVVLSNKLVNLAEINMAVGMMGMRPIVTEYQVAFENSFLPAFGHRMLQVVEYNNKLMPSIKVAVIDGGMANERIEVKFNKNGSFNLYDKKSNKEYSNLHVIEDIGDEGDEYNYSPPKNDNRISTENVVAEISLLHSTELQVAYLVKWSLIVPATMDLLSSSRSEKKVLLDIESVIKLDANSDRVDIVTTINNTAENHMLRALFASGAQSEYSYADNQFGVIKRDNLLSASENWLQSKFNEKPLPLYTQQLFVVHCDGDNGIAVLNKGLPEYEILDDSTIALSLLRAVGHVGRPDLTIRPGRVSGIDKAAPQAQMQGKYKFEYAVCACSKTTEINRIARMSKEFAIPVKCTQLMTTIKALFAGSEMKVNSQYQSEQQRNLADEAKKALQVHSSLPERSSIFSLSEGLELSAFKHAEKSKLLVVRCYNPGTCTAINQSIQMHDYIALSAEVANMRECSTGEKLTIISNSIQLPTINPGQALTLLIELSNNRDAEGRDNHDM